MQGKEEENRKQTEKRIAEYIAKREKALLEKEKVHKERMEKMTNQMLKSVSI